MAETRANDYLNDEQIGISPVPDIKVVSYHIRKKFIAKSIYK